MTTQFQTAGEVSALIESRLADITIANGCETDIGLRVLPGARKIEDEWVPCAVIIEGVDNVENGPSQRTASAKIAQHYVLGGYVRCDPQRPNDAAHKVIRDLKRAIFKGGANLDGKVAKVEYKGRDIGPRTDGVNIVFAIIEIVVTYVENLAEP